MCSRILYYLYRMKDNFSRQADIYAKYRPGYPPELFDFILSSVKERNNAWDCATGNGQTAKELAPYFSKVFATDISARQLEQATVAPNIIYSVQPAEETNFPDHRFDLVTISQALHWLQFDAFYKEVKRVTKPGGWIAAWMYSMPEISPVIDEWLVVHFYKDTVGSYWDYERKYVDDNYATIPFPFDEISCPPFHIHFEWTLQELEGYINTWSALQKFISKNGFNPVGDFMKKIEPLWEGERMPVSFPVSMRMGQVNK